MKFTTQLRYGDLGNFINTISYDMSQDWTKIPDGIYSYNVNDGHGSGGSSYPNKKIGDGILVVKTYQIWKTYFCAGIIGIGVMQVKITTGTISNNWKYLLFS